MSTVSNLTGSSRDGGDGCLDGCMLDHGLRHGSETVGCATNSRVWTAARAWQPSPAGSGFFLFSFLFFFSFSFFFLERAVGRLDTKKTELDSRVQKSWCVIVTSCALLSSFFSGDRPTASSFAALLLLLIIGLLFSLI